MRRLFEFLMAHPLAMLLPTVIGLFAAFFGVKSLPVDVFPELKVPRVTIQVEAAGLTAEEVEQRVTIPLESVVNGLPGVTMLRSSSGAGLSFVWADFDWGTDVYRARQMVSERIAGMDCELAPIVSVTGEIMLIALTGDEAASPLEMRRVAEYELRPRLMSVPGIGQVVVMGGELPEYQINVSLPKLSFLNLTLDDVARAVEDAQNIQTAGYLADVRGQELPIRQLARITSLEDLRMTPLRANLSLAEAADVKIGGAPRRGSAAFNGQPCVLLAVQKVPGGNTLQLTEQVDRVLENFRKANLPAGMTLSGEAYRQADFISLSIQNGAEIIGEAALIVLIVLFIIVGCPRATLVTLTALPLSIALALAFFKQFGIGLNIMTLGGLAVAVGDVTDNAVIFVEAAWRKLAGVERPQRRKVMVEVAQEVFNPAGFSTLIILLVFVPLLLMTGIEGQFFQPLAISYSLAMLASLFVAFTVVPVLCLFFFKSAKERKLTFASRLIHRIYDPLLNFCLRFPRLICSFAVLVTAGAVWLACTFGTSFLPPFQEDCLNVFVSTIPGTSLDETERVSEGIMNALREIDGVKSVARRTGRAERDEHAEPVSASEFLVRVDLTKDQRQLRNEVNRIIHSLPGVSGMIGYPIAHRISSVLSGTAAEVTVNIFGNDLPILREAARQASIILAQMKTVSDVRANREILVDSACIRYRREDLLRFGLSQDEVASIVATAVNGRTLGEVVENQSRWDIVLRAKAEERDTPETLSKLMILAADGRRFTLDELADVYREETANLIVRDNGMRKALISCNASPDANIGAMVEELQEKLEPVIHKLGCTVTYGGTYAARVSARKQLMQLGGVILVVIVCLLTTAAGSFKRALLVLVNLPLAVIGGVAAVWLFSQTAQPILSVASLAGFVTLAGFAIRNGLLLLNRSSALEEEGVELRESLRLGAKERVLPILMTSLTTILGLLPIVFAVDQPGGELLAPLAIVQFGGLISATLLNLLILPAAAYATTRKRK